MTVNSSDSSGNINLRQSGLIALSYENGKFGAAVFADKQLQILPEDKNFIDSDGINFLSINNESVKIITSTRSSLNQLKQCIPQNVSILLVPASDFTFMTKEELAETCNITFDIESHENNVETFKSLNALSTYLRKNNQNIPQTVSIFEIESDRVIISNSCLDALQIFDQKLHPNMHAANQGSKEGCSIFSLFNHCVSEEGRQKLKRWFLQPTNNLITIKTRHNSIEVLMQAEMSMFVKTCTKSLKKCFKISVCILLIENLV
jgi:DNA mismatch repair ATPase MutS